MPTSLVTKSIWKPESRNPIAIEKWKVTTFSPDLHSNFQKIQRRKHSHEIYFVNLRPVTETIYKLVVSSLKCYLLRKGIRISENEVLYRYCHRSSASAWCKTFLNSIFLKFLGKIQINFIYFCVNWRWSVTVTARQMPIVTTMNVVPLAIGATGKCKCSIRMFIVSIS